jgi:shikimate dehydrogenase
LKVNGETKLVGLIGYPVSHSLSPVIFNAAFKEVGLNWCYVPLPVRNESDLKVVLEGLKACGFVGVNVTMPHKESILKCLDEVTAFAKMVSAVNVVHIRNARSVGYNTDGRGFLASLENLGFSPKGKRILLLGAGGAARAVAWSLVLSGVRKIVVANRTPIRGEMMVEKLKERFPQCETFSLSFEQVGSEVVEEAEIIINATPLGMDGKSFPLSLSAWEGLNPIHLVYDLIYWPPLTPLLKLAQERGAKVESGLSMLIEQGAEAFSIWTGFEAPVERMKEVALRFLEEKHGQAKEKAG